MNEGDVDSTEKCEHEPDMTTIEVADSTQLPGVVDVWCSKCGTSGSVTIKPEDILW